MEMGTSVRAAQANQSGGPVTRVDAVMYFWAGKQVILEPRHILATECKEYLNMPCCDDSSDDYSFGRYGAFRDVRGSGHSWDYFWAGCSVVRLPKEFRTQLLLLGVS